MLQLYGDEGNPTTVRAEMHRLRNLLGDGVLDTKPYRIIADVTGDVTDVQKRAASRGPRDQALDLYSGPLLTRSDAPALRAERDELDATIRRACSTPPIPICSGASPRPIPARRIWRFSRS